MRSIRKPHRFFSPTVVASLLGLAGLSFACDKSPTAPGATAPATLTVPTAVPATPPTRELTGDFSLAASPSRVNAGDQLAVRWVAPGGQGCNGGGDWIAIFKVGNPDITGAANGHSDLWYEHLCGATTGTWTLSAPTQPGQYEFRYMVNATSAARSNPVTVSAAASPLVPPVHARDK